MPLVLGVDSSTQSTKAVLVDADDGTVVDQRSAAHPPGTSVDPRAWIEALDDAAGPLLARAEAVAVGGQQHGSVVLDEPVNRSATPCCGTTCAAPVRPPTWSPSSVAPTRVPS